MSEIRERLKETERAIERWRAANDPINAALKLQWEFVQLDNLIGEVKKAFRKGDLLFEILDEEVFDLSNWKELGETRTFLDRPGKLFFVLPAEQFFQLKREELFELFQITKPYKCY